MNSLLFYVIQVIVVSGILYFYYHLFLRNEKFHAYNRFYILASSLLSIVIPFLDIPLYFTADQANSSIFYKTISVFSEADSYDSIVFDDKVTSPASTGLSLSAVIYLVYILVAFLIFMRIIISLIKIYRIIRKYTIERIDTIIFINTEEPGTPFSFFRYLFWNRNISLDSAKGQQVFRHEIFHIEQKHSLDIFWMEMLTVACWVNPFFHLMKKEIKAIHEFLADRFAIKKSDKWEYAELLLMQMLDTRISLINQFFHNQIKRRIAMITSSKKSSLQYLRKLLVLPLCASLVLVFAFTYRKINKEGLKEPQAAGQPAMPVISELPVKDPNETDQKTITGNAVPDTVPARPLIIINGKERPDLDTSEAFHLLSNKIYSVNVLKGTSATKKYGIKGKYGIIEITTGNENDFNKAPFRVVTTDGSKPVRTKRSMYVNSNDNIMLEADSIVCIPKASREDPDFRKALVIVNGEKKDFDFIKNKTLLSATVMVYQRNNPEAIRLYGNDAREGAIVFTGAKIIDMPNKEYYGEKKKEDKDNKVFVKVEIEPSFPGGAEKWKNYTAASLDQSVPVNNNAPKGEYTVVLQFIVRLDGTITDILPLTKHGYGMEAEAVRVLSKGPKWNPGIQNGKQVVAYMKALFNFSVPGKKENTASRGIPVIKLSELRKSDPVTLLQIERGTEIISYTITAEIAGGDIIELKNSGAVFTEPTKKAIAEVKAGTLLSIDEIVVKREGLTRRIPSRVFQVEAD